MKYSLDTIKGMHPGALIKHELNKRHISQRQFAAEIQEHWQTLNAIINEKRGISINAALKIEEYFEYDEGTLSIMQVYYDIEKKKQHELSKTLKGIPNIRRILFWDTDFDKINWAASKDSIISRVMERGTETEKEEIMRYYNIPFEKLSQLTSKCKPKYKYHGIKN